MPPEILVLAWALLFVVASGLAFRFIFWLGRRSRARQSSDVALNSAEDGVSTKAAAPLSVSPPPPAPLAVDVPRTASRSAVAANVPKPAPARDYASPRSSVEPAAPNVERAVGVADEPAAVIVDPPRASPRAPLKPNVGATLPPTIAATVLQKASIAATLPPAPVEPTARIAQVVEPVAEPAAPAVATAPEPAPDLPAPAAPSGGRTTLLNSWLLRAWKLGAIAPRLPIRLKESRNRKVVPVPKTSRKPPETVITTVSTKELKVLAQRSTPDRASVRRIRREGAENILASAQAQTRIVGVPPRGYRVLAADEL